MNLKKKYIYLINLANNQHADLINDAELNDLLLEENKDLKGNQGKFFGIFLKY